MVYSHISGLMCRLQLSKTLGGGAHTLVVIYKSAVETVRVVYDPFREAVIDPTFTSGEKTVPLDFPLFFGPPKAAGRKTTENYTGEHLRTRAKARA